MFFYTIYNDPKRTHYPSIFNEKESKAFKGSIAMMKKLPMHEDKVQQNNRF